MVLTSTRTDYYPPQSLGGTAYARESFPSTCHAVQLNGTQGLKVTVNNVPGASAYNVYVVHNATSSPCNQLLYGYAGSITNSVVETTASLGSVNATFTATSIPTAPDPGNIGLACNVGIPQLLWLQRVRRSAIGLFVVAVFVNVGMWLERFVIVVESLHRDFLPSSWGMYSGTVWDYSTFVGSIGLFLALMFLFIRFLPMISIAEMRAILPEAHIDEDPRPIV